MLRIALIRPGATDYDLQGRIQGSLDIPLCDTGVREVEQLAPALRPLDLHVIYTADGEPARQTATMLAEALDAKVKCLDGLTNMSLGLWQGMLVEEVRRKLPKVYQKCSDQPECVCPPEGETLGEARERVQEALAKIAKKNKDGVVGLVLSEPLASLARACLNHTPVGDLWEVMSEHGTWELIERGTAPVPVAAARTSETA
ncbi:MAG: histidine phosphatase family protein [Planctomycetes bacterium]|nr:histidine phosphatase family protein [Planctomycetota bacterium]